MSEASNRTTTTQNPTTDNDQLTDEERAIFERIADRYEGEDIGEISKAVLQSSSREARS